MSIASSSMLVNITLSVWSGRKLDREVSEEVDQAKSTKTRAGNYNKNLFAGVTELETVRQIAGKIRNWHQTQTLPWSDGGERLLTMANFLDYKRQLNDYEREFNDAVKTFCVKYPNLIAAQAFTMGSLFKRDEYPDVNHIASKFSMRYTFSPVPEVGDWRVQADESLKQELSQQYEQVYKDRLGDITNDLWQRLHGCLTHMSERLDDAPDGSKKIFRDSLLGNAVELCGLLTKLNVTGDPQLEQARKQLESAIVGVDVKDLRKHDGARKEIKSQVDDILKTMAF
jgi:hypothetical protein